MGVDHPGLGMSMGELVRTIRRIARATIQNASIGRAGIRVYDAGAIRFEGGGGVVIVDSGYIQIDGDLTGAGDLSWTGPWTFSGAGTVTGNVAWSGDLNLTGDIKVLPGGRVQVGNMIIDPANGGKVTFPGGAVISAGTGGGISIEQGNSYVSVITGNSALMNAGKGFEVDGFYAGPRIRGMPTIASAAAGGLPVGAVWANSDGVLFRVVMA